MPEAQEWSRCVKVPLIYQGSEVALTFFIERQITQAAVHQVIVDLLHDPMRQAAL
jgi:hypothetical protein